MSLLYVCDQCEYQQPTPLDDDGDPVMMLFHLCSAQCLSNMAMGLTLDFEGD